MRFQVVTLFPELIQQSVQSSIIGRAVRNGIISVDTVCIRDFSTNRHGRVDDYPYGGGAGMVMEAEPVYQAVRTARRQAVSEHPRVIYLTPQAEVLNQTKVESLALEEDLILLCGHYEGIDERVLEEVVTDYVSIGDYVLTGGETGAIVMIDAVSRFVPGVLGNETSADFESLQDNLLEYPHYTRPEVWRGRPVPEILLSGDHRKVEAWRHAEAVRRTQERRPDLLARALQVKCLWYGSEAAEALASRLMTHVTRYGEILNYNRNALRKKMRGFTAQELVLLVTDETDAEQMPRKLKGSGTRVVFIQVDASAGDAGMSPDDKESAEVFPEVYARFLEANGFVPEQSGRLPADADDGQLIRVALEIRARM